MDNISTKFIDTIFDVSSYSGQQLDPTKDSDQPIINAKYYLGRVLKDSGLAPLHDSNYFPMLRIDPDSGGDD